MNTDLLVKNDVISKVWKKIDILAEAKGMTRKEFIEWSEAEHNRSNISGYEFNLITAYQISKAIERLKVTNKIILAENTERDYSWINRFKKDFIKVDEAIKHLKEVCEYVREQEGIEYENKHLIDYDNILFDRIIERSKGKDKKSKLVRND